MLRRAPILSAAGVSLLMASCGAFAEPAAPITSSSDLLASVQTLPRALPQTALTSSGLYMAEESIITIAWTADAADEPVQTIIPAGTRLTVLDWVQDDIRGALVRLGLETADNDEVSDDLPADILVKRSAFEGFALQEETRLSKAEANEIASADADSYVSYAADVVARRGGSARSARGRRGMTYCYRYVKKHLLKEGLVDSYIPGGSAYMAIKSLPKYGFKRLYVSNPEKAPMGSICVYDRDKRNRHGHIEVKKSDTCYWFGYGCNKNSMYGRRDFYDCYAKKGSGGGFWNVFSRGGSSSKKDDNPETKDLIRRNDPSQRS